MASLARFSRIAYIPALFWAVSCFNNEPDGGKPPTGNSNSSGFFRIILTQQTEINQGLPTVTGKVYEGPLPSALAWFEKAKSGACTLYEPKAPFCASGCGSNALCVTDSVCKAYPKSIGVGRVTVTGVKTKSGTTTFSMDPILNGYQPPAGTNLEYVPFAEGDPVSVSAAGDTGLGAFSVSAKAIARLDLLNDSIVLADGQPIELKWTPPGKDVGSKIAVEIDISHHGGTKGKIECETADNGSLTIAASLVDALKALGVSGWPQIEVSRKTAGSNDQVHVDLEIESPISMQLSIPGLISCTDDSHCPDGKTCKQDMQCK